MLYMYNSHNKNINPTSRYRVYIFIRRKILNVRCLWVFVKEPLFHWLFFQTRINALVEQEVKRRMFEEKRQRENLRKQEREKEKFERDLEIQTLKEQHSRELKQLRAKYESTQELSRFENFIHASMYIRNYRIWI